MILFLQKIGYDYPLGVGMDVTMLEASLLFVESVSLCLEDSKRRTTSSACGKSSLTDSASISSAKFFKMATLSVHLSANVINWSNRKFIKL